jgi:hypothetical protein
MKSLISISIFSIVGSLAMAADVIAPLEYKPIPGSKYEKQYSNFEIYKAPQVTDISRFNGKYELVSIQGTQFRISELGVKTAIPLDQNQGTGSLQDNVCANKISVARDGNDESICFRRTVYASRPECIENHNEFYISDDSTGRIDSQPNNISVERVTTNSTRYFTSIEKTSDGLIFRYQKSLAAARKNKIANVVKGPYLARQADVICEYKLVEAIDPMAVWPNPQ